MRHATRESLTSLILKRSTPLSCPIGGVHLSIYTTTSGGRVGSENFAYGDPCQKRRKSIYVKLSHAAAQPESLKKRPKHLFQKIKIHILQKSIQP